MNCGTVLYKSIIDSNELSSENRRGRREEREECKCTTPDSTTCL